MRWIIIGMMIGLFGCNNDLDNAVEKCKKFCKSERSYLDACAYVNIYLPDADYSKSTAICYCKK